MVKSEPKWLNGMALTGQRKGRGTALRLTADRYILDSHRIVYGSVEMPTSFSCSGMLPSEQGNHIRVFEVEKQHGYSRKRVAHFTLPTKNSPYAIMNLPIDARRVAPFLMRRCRVKFEGFVGFGVTFTLSGFRYIRQQTPVGAQYNGIIEEDESTKPESGKWDPFLNRVVEVAIAEGVSLQTAFRIAWRLMRDERGGGSPNHTSA